ncbi:MAG: methyltransferase domain-containing protein [Pirellulales bacterium]|nr:methyltransferase domain-containing protein [Pirellulales bacterium]
MRNRMAEYQVFWREFRESFQTTGAVLPSGRALARALASRVGARGRPQRILEVGPGTGAVTNSIIARLGPADQLDLVELNPRFADLLRNRIRQDLAWQPVAQRIHVLEMPVENIDNDGRYDVIVSGLPLNNFPSEQVAQILEHFHRLAARGAQLSFFEYAVLRKAKALWCKPYERRRLTMIEQLLEREFSSWQVAVDCVLANVPPAWVHHLCLPGLASQPRSLAAQTVR